jgi:hypothetical protein
MKAMVEGKRRAILDDVVLGVGADEVVHASLVAALAARHDQHGAHRHDLRHRWRPATHPRSVILMEQVK